MPRPCTVDELEEMLLPILEMDLAEAEYLLEITTVPAYKQDLQKRVDASKAQIEELKLQILEMKQNIPKAA